MTRRKIRYVRIPSKVWDGIGTLVSHCEAGAGADSLEIDTDDPEGARLWANVEAACRWVRDQQTKEHT